MRNRIIFTTLGILVLLNTIIPTLNINALDAILVAPDILDVGSPAANATVKGTINVVWKMYDDAQNVIPYTANIYDAQTCNQTNFGSISSNSNGVSSRDQYNSISWNTKTTLTNPNIADGTYCLKICAAFKGGNKPSDNKPYSACNGRNITILNNNRLPSITSIPGNLNILQTDSWTYQIRATDPDGDRLTYRFVTKPAFLDINNTTGLITSNGINKNPGNNDTVKYNVVIAVDDNLSGSVTQQFELTIRKPAGSTTPPVTPPTNPNPVPPTTPPAPINNPTQITFENPVKDELYSEEVNIKWNITDTDGIKSIKLEYSTDGIEWNEITEVTDTTLTEYKWDTSDLENGKYLVRIHTTDNLNTETSKSSNEFEIKNQDEEEVPVESVPLIINISPVNNSEIKDNTPIISGEFVPSEGASMDITSFVINLDDEDIKDQCVVDQIGFSCTLLDELSDGNHKILVNIRDTNNTSTTTEWNFSVINGNPVSAPSDTILIFGSEIPRASLVLAIVIFIIVILLLAIPWILYVLWNKRNKRKSEYENPMVAENNQVETNYGGYYLPPYNPVPSVDQPRLEDRTDSFEEPASQQKDPLEEYINSFNDQFTEPNPVQESTITERAEPQIMPVIDEAKPVIPQENTTQSLAQVEPKIENAMNTEAPINEPEPLETVQNLSDDNLLNTDKLISQNDNIPANTNEFTQAAPIDSELGNNQAESNNQLPVVPTPEVKDIPTKFEQMSKQNEAEKVDGSKKNLPKTETGSDEEFVEPTPID